MAVFFEIWANLSEDDLSYRTDPKLPKNQKITGNLNGFGVTVGYKTKCQASICSNLYKIIILYSS